MLNNRRNKLHPPIEKVFSWLLFPSSTFLTNSFKSRIAAKGQVHAKTI